MQTNTKSTQANEGLTLVVGGTGKTGRRIADVAVAALTEAGHAGQIYEVTGSRALTFAEAVAEISRACGRDVRYRQIPGESFAAGVADSGAPADIVWLLDYLFATVLDGRNAHVGDGVKRALGREPADFADYAQRAANSGLWNVSSSPERALAG